MLNLCSQTVRIMEDGVTKFYIRNENIKNNAISIIREIECNDKSPIVVTVTKMNRSLPQNAMFHSLCGDLERSGFIFCGKPRSATQWKVILISGHSIAVPEDGDTGEIIAGIQGEIVSLRESSAQMKVSRMTSLIEYTMAFCIDNGIPISEPRLSQYHGGYEHG